MSDIPKMKDLVISWGLSTLVALMAAAIPIGFGMALYTDNTNWLWLCLFVLIFLS